MFQREAPSHVLHFFISFCFAPWVFVWLILGFGGTSYRCSRCGSEGPGSAPDWLWPVLVLGVELLAWVAIFIFIGIVASQK